MHCYHPTPTDHSTLLLMWQLHSKLTQQSSPHLLLLQQKIIYASFIYASYKTICPQLDKQQVAQLITNFVQKINRLAMENYQTTTDNKQQQLIGKAVRIMMHPQLPTFLLDQWQVTKLKILNYNNLACLYKRRKRHGVALRCVDQAILLQQKLMLDSKLSQKYDIVPTYLNKAAIYSQMKRHKQSLAVIYKAKKHITSIEQQLLEQIQRSKDEDQGRLLEKRHYGLYMKMLILYNLGAEKQNLREKGEAVEYYKQAKQIAIIISNRLMTDKLEGIIDSLMEGK